LFGYFRDRGELTKAADYGWKMLHSEPVDVQTIGSLVDVLARLNRRDQARTAIQVLAARSKGEANPYWAGALLTYGQVFNDETALKEAVRQFEILVRLQPGNIGLMKMLVSANELMGGVRSEVGTTKTTTTSCKS
jgi:predicted Zn-dependent protease